jgi:hypothetical protein
VRGVVKLRLSKKDLEQGVEFLLDVIGQHTEVKCVFLGKYQSLGSAGRGDPRTIRRVCEQRGVEVLPSNISVLGSLPPLQAKRVRTIGRVARSSAQLDGPRG